MNILCHGNQRNNGRIPITPMRGMNILCHGNQRNNGRIPITPATIAPIPPPTEAPIALLLFCVLNTYTCMVIKSEYIADKSSSRRCARGGKSDNWCARLVCKVRPCTLTQGAVSLFFVIWEHQFLCNNTLIRIPSTHRLS